MTDEAAAALRIGCVGYLNAQPLIHGWPGPVVFDHPSRLCGQLAAGSLDVALVSAFEFLRDPIYTIVDEVAVAADGAVHSVVLAHRAPLKEITEIALDPASRTSVNLLRVLLVENGLHPRLTDGAADARLLIGDQAIRFRAEHREQFRYWDLAAEWKRLTDLSFVFALWLIRPAVPDAVAIARALRARRDSNLQALDQVIAAQKDFSAEFCAFYFGECLRFNFGEREKTGLLHFRALCEKHGILPSGAASLKLA